MLHSMSTIFPTSLYFIVAQITYNTQNQACPHPLHKQLAFKEAQYHILKIVTLMHLKTTIWSLLGQMMGRSQMTILIMCHCH